MTDRSLLLSLGVAAGMTLSCAVAEPAGGDVTTLAEGLTVERVEASMPAPVPGTGPGVITLVRVDPRRYRFRLLSAMTGGGGGRPLPQWVDDERLVGGINASMFQSGGASTGLMVDGDATNNGRVHPSFGAFFAFNPTRGGLPPVALVGRSCEGFDLERLRGSYATVIQNYRLLSCSGGAIRWQDEKRYSVAAVGLDRDGRVVFIHSRTPYRMRDFNTMIAAPDLRIRSAMFVEGGPEASLYVRTGSHEVAEVGSWEDGFFDASNRVFWPVPNVVGFEAISGGDAGEPSR